MSSQMLEKVVNENLSTFCETIWEHFFFFFFFFGGGGGGGGGGANKVQHDILIYNNKVHLFRGGFHH